MDAPKMACQELAEVMIETSQVQMTAEIKAELEETKVTVLETNHEKTGGHWTPCIKAIHVLTDLQNSDSTVVCQAPKGLMFKKSGRLILNAANT